EGRVDRAAPKDQDVGVAALGQVELRRHWNEGHAIALVQSATQGMHLRRVHLLGHEELARPVRGDLARTGDRIASEANDMVVVENSNGCWHGFHLLKRARTSSTSAA